MSLQRAKELLAEADMLPWISERTLFAMMLAIAGSGQVSALLFVAQSVGDGTYRTSTGLSALLVAALWAIIFCHRWLGGRRALTLFLGQLWVTITYLQSYRGLTPSTALASVALLLMCSAVYSYFGLCVGLCAVVLSLAVSVTAAMAGLLVPWGDSLWDVQRPVVWLRCIVLMIGNARDALGECGSFTIDFGERTVPDPPLGWRAEPGSYIAISCSDTGCGMDEATRQHVFEPFFTTKAAGKGTGLGLAMTHRLLYDAGGFIEFESELGVGTTFRLLLPRIDRERAVSVVTSRSRN